MARPMHPLVSNQTLGLLVLTLIACFTVVTLIAHSYVSLLEDAADQDAYAYVDRQRLQAALRKNAQLNKQQLKAHDLLIQQHNTRTMKIKALYEQEYPPGDAERTRNFVRQLRRPNEYQTQLNVPYDIYKCPPIPPPNYPVAWNVMDVLNNWNPANTTEPARLHQSLCVFDYESDFRTAETYRKAEVPFLIRNIPKLQETAERWSHDPEYLSRMLQGSPEKTEHSHNNHFMYFKTQHIRRLPDGWIPPMETIEMSFEDWYERAQNVKTDEPNQERYYFRINAVKKGPHDFLYEELPIFEPVKHNFFMVDPTAQRGINCRFGMKGVMAETHYDQSRNFIVLLKGQRRYILAHPRQCPNLGLYPAGHPSGRHSAVDWTNPDLVKFPEFGRAEVQEVVLQAGYALYLPTFWFHFIVSLNVNYQCNARSGMTKENARYIQDCGFQ